MAWRPALASLLLFSIIHAVIAIDPYIIDTIYHDDELIWCTTSNEENYKCNNMTKALERDRKLFKDKYLQLKCHQAFDRDECMDLLDNEKADIMSVDSGDVFIGGRFHSLVPIMQEVERGGLRYVYAVAVVKKGSMIDQGYGLRGLRGAKACFPAVGTYAGWVLPIDTLMKEAGLEIVDCNNHVKSVINFFGPSCAPNSLVDKYNPIGDNSDKLCELCTGKTGTRCSLSDPYAGYNGAFRCLLEAGEIAFLKHTTIPHILNTHPEFSSLSPDKFELLCKDGSRRPIFDHLSCNFGRAPTNALVVSSVKKEDQIIKYQKFIKMLVEIYEKSNDTDYNRQRNPDGSFNDRDQFGNPILQRDPFGNPITQRDQFGNPITQRDQFGNPITQRDQFGNPIIQRDPFGKPIQTGRDIYGSSTSDPLENEYGGRGWDINTLKKQASTTENYYGTTMTIPQVYENFSLFDSSHYGSKTDLMFDDTTRSFLSIAEPEQSAGMFLGQSEKAILSIRSCTVNRIVLCVTSDPEQDKCVKMRTAMRAHLLKPDLSCYRGTSQINCMQAVRAGIADVTMLEAGDVWEGARHFALEPIMAEVYGSGKSSYYAVAVAKDSDPDTDLTFLRGKNTCHTGINTAAGWIYPLAYLLSNGWIRPYGCDAVRAAAQWFSRSCVPGAVSFEYNEGVPHDPLCRLCQGTSFRHCKRDASENYFGHIGALRCLVEGGGDVAFVRDSAVAEIAGGRREEWWARNTLKDDFQLLCPDGTRATVNDYKKCNLGIVPGNAMVTRGGEAHNETEIAAYTNLFMYAQQFYGATDPDQFSFSMFMSAPPYTDLIFSDSARQLKPLMGRDRSASHYLGRVFLRAHSLTDCTPSTSGSQKVYAYPFVVLLLAVIVQRLW